MSNRSGSGCCGGRNAGETDEAATTKHEKSGCGCEGEERKAETGGTEAGVAQATAAEATKTERKQGCCC